MPVKNKNGIPEELIGDLRLKGFKIHRIANPSTMPVTRARRDFYKMGLVSGNMTLNYGGKIVELKDNVLFFVNPNVPHSIVSRQNNISGYACLFTETFVTGRERIDILKHSPLCNTDAHPVVKLNKEQAAFVKSLFERMMAVHTENSNYRNEILRSSIELILHEALRIAPAPNSTQQTNGINRVTHLFIGLLERQFPVESPAEPLKLRTAHDFAKQLSVHVNYLNKAVKTVTGKPTSVHIAERIVAEAKALLQYTDWGTAEIAYALGFEYPTYFNNYFKRLTGTTPKAIRQSKV
jgi:AraC-like DNA-binding protein